MKEREIQAISGIFLSPDHTKALLLHRNPGRTYSQDEWDVMGGNIEPGETPEEALSRDMREKLGIKFAAVEQTGQISVAEADATIIRNYFQCQIGEETVILDPTKYYEYGWFNADQIARLKLTTGAQAVLKEIGLIQNFV